MRRRGRASFSVIFGRALGGFKDYKLVSLVEFVWCFALRKKRFFCVVFQVEILRGEEGPTW